MAVTPQTAAHPAGPAPIHAPTPSASTAAPAPTLATAPAAPPPSTPDDVVDYTGAEQAQPMQGLRRRRSGAKRALPKATPVYFVFQVLGEDGQPMQFSKSRIKILACERNTDKVLDIIDGDEHEHAVYIRGMLAPARVPGGGAASNGAASG